MGDVSFEGTVLSRSSPLRVSVVSTRGIDRGDESSQARRPASHLASEDATRRVGARVREPADGRLVGDDPQPAAAVHGRHAGRERVLGRTDRRRRRIDRADREDLLRCGQRLAGPAQGAGGVRLCAGRLHQAAVRVRAEPGLGAGRALRRPDRQGHPRRAARRAGGGHRAAGDPRRRVRAAPVAGHRGRLRRPAAGNRADAAVGQRRARGVQGRDHSRPAGGGAAAVRRARAGSACGRQAPRQSPRPRAARPAGTRVLAGDRNRRGVRARPLQRGLPGAACRGLRRVGGVRAAGDGGDERDLRRPRLPGRGARRPHVASHAAGDRAGGADRRRSRARRGPRLARADRRGRAVGRAHGPDPGPARGDVR